MSLHRVVYFSFARQEATPEALTDILEASVRNNLRDGITGVLLYKNDMFLQVLEGGERELRRLLERLKQDLRHRDLTVLIDEPANRRQFERWAMALVDSSLLPLPTQRFCQALPSLLDDMPRSDLGRELRGLFEAFATATGV